MDARLQFGPYDGQEGHVRVPVPLAIDISRCGGCGCGRPFHYKVAAIDEPPARGYYRYELIEIAGGCALYRHADTLDPVTEQTIAEICGA